MVKTVNLVALILVASFCAEAVGQQVATDRVIASYQALASNLGTHAFQMISF